MVKKVRPVKHGAKVDLTTWNLDSVNEIAQELLQQKFLETVSEALQCATDECADAYFPIQWNFGDDPDDGIGGKPVKSPDILRVSLPLGADEDFNPHWDISLTETVRMFIEGGTVRGKIPADSSDRAKALRDKFRELAAMIDSALE